jgi:uncharacterized protein (DUF305 family)
MRTSLMTGSLALAVALLATGCAGHPGMMGHDHESMHAGMQHHMMDGAAMPEGSGSRQLQQSMMSGMHQMHSAMQWTGDTDKDFVRMMRLHHLQGVEMARIELQKGSSPEMKQMAQKIVDSQTKEVAEFDRWLQAHR